MTRATAPGTRTQRADRPEAVPADVRARGFEPSDAPAGKVGLAIVGLLAALGLSGAVVAGLLGLIAQADQRSQPPGLLSARLIPPPPRLERDPRADRLRLEAAARARVGEAPTDVDHGAPPTGTAIATAMRAVAARGWPDDAPAPSAAASARAHAEARQ